MENKKNFTGNKFNELIIKGMMQDEKFVSRLALLLNQDQLHKLVDGVPVEWTPNLEKIQDRFSEWKNVEISKVANDTIYIKGVSKNTRWYRSQEDADNNSKDSKSWKDGSYVFSREFWTDATTSISLSDERYSDCKVF